MRTVLDCPPLFPAVLECSRLTLLFPTVFSLSTRTVQNSISPSRTLPLNTTTPLEVGGAWRKLRIIFERLHSSSTGALAVDLNTRQKPTTGLSEWGVS